MCDPKIVVPNYTGKTVHGGINSGAMVCVYDHDDKLVIKVKEKVWK